MDIKTPPDYWYAHHGVRAPVTQLVEWQSYELQVEGSNPSWSIFISFFFCT